MSAAGRLVEVRVPEMGNFKDVAIIDVLVKPGDTVEQEAPLVTLESEKATMDVPSTVSGVVEKVHISKGGTVSAGDLVATLRAADAAAAPGPPPAAATDTVSAATAPAAAAAAPAPAPAPRAAAAAPGQPAPAAAAPAAPLPPGEGPAPGYGNGLPPINEPGFSRAHASPSVRHFARELGVDLTLVTGTGFKSRITHEDVKSFVKSRIAAPPQPAPAPAAPSAALPQVPRIDFAQFGAVELRPLSRIQRISGPRLHASWVNVPHVTQFDEADITDLEALREKLKDQATAAGIKLTPLAFILRACVRALQEFPVFNSSLDETGQNLVLKKYVHVGFAADTPNGLVVPVVRDADRKDIYEIARCLADLAGKARAGKLAAPEMQGGSFTISSLGGIGGTAFTPIINAPEVAILGVSRSALRPLWRDDAFVPRLMLPLSLSYDHRVIDGAAAARFTSFLARTLAEAPRLVEAVP